MGPLLIVNSPVPHDWLDHLLKHHSMRCGWLSHSSDRSGQLTRPFINPKKVSQQAAHIMTLLGSFLVPNGLSKWWCDRQMFPPDIILVVNTGTFVSAKHPVCRPYRPRKMGCAGL